MFMVWSTEHLTIVNDDFRVITKLEASLTDDTRVIIYDHHMFMAQAAEHLTIVNDDSRVINKL